MWRAARACSWRLARLSRLTAVAVALTAGALTPPLAPASERPRNGLIAYTARVREDVAAIRAIRPDGTHPRTLVGPDDRFRGGASGPRWSRDGRRLLFLRMRDPDGGTGSLWYAAPAGRRIHRIPLGLGKVAVLGYDWAPGRRRIVFAAGDAARPLLYTIALDGGHRRRLGPGQAPSWSADGRHIVFISRMYRGTGTPGDEDADEIAVIRPDGTGFRRLTGSSHDTAPSLSPDGRTVAFVRSDPRLEADQWRTVDISGRRDRLIAAHPYRSRFFYCPPQWTPDGRRLAAVRARDDPNAPSGVLVTLALRDRREHVAFTFPFPVVRGWCGIAWQPRR